MLKKAAMTFGVVLTIVGILGFIPSLLTDGKLFNLFQVNHLDAIVWLVVGLIGLYSAMSASMAKTYFAVFGVIYALWAILGFVYGSNEILGILANNMADTWLYVVLAVIALIFGFGMQEES